MAPDKGARLNKRVWTLFEKAGFQTQPSSTSPTEHEVTLSPRKKRPVDLLACEPQLGIRIIGSNKSGGVTGSWTAHISDCETIGKKANADKVLLVITGKELSGDDIAYAKDKDMVIWDETKLAYFEAVTESIGTYAKYEIIHTLGLSTNEEKQTYRVLALRLRQPDNTSQSELFLFTIPPERLLKTCVIYRRAQGNPLAYQRMLNRKRLPRVGAFVTKPNAILPTNIIVHLSDKVTIDEIKEKQLHDKDGKPITLSKAQDYELVVLNIPLEYASLELIDGQHRLYGFTKTEPATRISFNLVVLGVMGLGQGQRQDTFVAINDNSRRMDPNLVAYLRYTNDDAACQSDNGLMAIRLAVDLNKTTPLKDSIRLLDVGNQRITLKGFSGYDLKGLLGPRGVLRKYYPDNMPQQYLQVLRIYFSTIKSLFNKEWKDPNTYILPTNRGVSAFLKLLRSIIQTEQSQITHPIAHKYLSSLRKHWKDWKLDKLSKSYVGSQGWKDFHRDLVKAIKKDHPDFE